MSISFSGLASGLDTSSWVESLVALRQAKIDTLEEQKETVLLSRETLNNIKSFFNSFRSVLEKVTDAKFGIVSTDIFAQKLATSSNLNVLTGTATHEAEEATYNVLVDKLATSTEAMSGIKHIETTVTTEIAGFDTKLTDLGVKAGEIGINNNGYNTIVSITDNDTISSFITKLSNAGIQSSYNDKTGIFSANLDNSAIDDTLTKHADGTVGTGIVEIFNLREIGGYESGKLDYSETDTIVTTATGDTKLSTLGVNAGAVTIEANGAEYTFNITNNSTIDEFVNAMKGVGIDASFKDGLLRIIDAEITGDSGTNLIKALGLETKTNQNTQGSDGLSYSEVKTASGGDRIGDFISGANGAVNVYDKNGNLVGSVTVKDNTTFDDLFDDLSQYGITGRIKDGVVSFSSTDGNYVTGGLMDKLGVGVTTTTVTQTSGVGASSGGLVTYDSVTGETTTTYQTTTSTTTSTSTAGSGMSSGGQVVYDSVTGETTTIYNTTTSTTTSTKTSGTGATSDTTIDYETVFAEETVTTYETVITTTTLTTVTAGGGSGSIIEVVVEYTTLKPISTTTIVTTIGTVTTTTTTTVTQSAGTSPFVNGITRIKTDGLQPLSDVTLGVNVLASGTYAINTKDDLLKLAEISNSNKMGVDCTFVLGADIDLSGVTWTIINNFSGTFNGNGYVIKNLKIANSKSMASHYDESSGSSSRPSSSSSSPVRADYYATEGSVTGLFGYVSGNITNLGLENVDISSGANWIGGIAGYSSGTISNCYVTGKVTRNSSSSSSFGSSSEGIRGAIGAVIGYAASNVSNLYASATVTNTGSISTAGTVIGLVADNRTIENCVAKGSVSGGIIVGGIVGSSLSSNWSTNSGTNISLNIRSCYADVTLSNSTVLGGIIGSAMATSITISDTTAAGEITATSDTSTYAGGMIGQLNAVTWSESIDSNSSYVYSRSMNIAISNSTSTMNINAESTSGTKSSHVGGFIASTDDGDLKVTVTNCLYSGNLSGGTVGGFAGSLGDLNASLTLNVSGFTSAGTITAETYAGGFAGNVYSASNNGNHSASVFNFDKIYNKADIVLNNSGYVYAGGFIGKLETDYAVTISNSRSEGTISATAGQIAFGGGFLGYVCASSYSYDAYGANCKINIQDSSNIGDITVISTSTVTSTNSSHSANAGGIVGYANKTMNKTQTALISCNNVYNSGNVTAQGTNTNNIAGGLVGFGNISLTESCNAGNIRADGNSSIRKGYAGGLVGFGDGNVNQSYSTGNIYGSSYAAGIVAYASTVIAIETSYASGTIDGDSGCISAGIIASYQGGNYVTLTVTGCSVLSYSPNLTNIFVGEMGQYSSAKVANSYYNAEYNTVGKAIGCSYENVNTCGTNAPYTIAMPNAPTEAKGDSAKSEPNSEIIQIESVDVNTTTTYSTNTSTVITTETIKTTATISTTNTEPPLVYTTLTGQFMEQITRIDTVNLTALSEVNMNRALASGSYAIRTTEDLKLIGKYNDLGFLTGNYTFVLAADLDLQGENWTPITFTGNFEGNGYEISNLCIDMTNTTNGNNIGLFGTINGNVKNLGVKNVNIFVATGVAANIGAIAGKANDIQNCYVTGVGAVSVNKTNTNTTQVCVGGLVGSVENISYSYADITVSANNATSSGGDYDLSVASLVGNLNKSADYCYAMGNVDISGYANSSGLIGNLYKTGSSSGITVAISHCYTTSNVNIAGSRREDTRLLGVSSLRATYSYNYYKYGDSYKYAVGGTVYQTTTSAPFDFNQKESIIDVRAEYKVLSSKTITSSGTGPIVTTHIDTKTETITEVRTVPVTKSVAMTSATTFEQIGMTTDGTIKGKTATGKDFTITITSADTVGDIVGVLKDYGINASVRGGRIYINESDDAYLTSISQNVKNALGITKSDSAMRTVVTQTTITTTTTPVESTKPVTTKVQMTGETKFSELGMTSNTETIIGFANGHAFTMTVTSTDTVGDIVQELEDYGFNASVRGGKFYVDGSEGIYLTGISSNLKTALGITSNPGAGTSYTVTTHTTLTTTTTPIETTTPVTTKIQMSDDTLFSQLGMSSDGTIKGVHNGKAFTIAVTGSDSVGDIVDALSQYGITASVRGGKIYINSSDDAYITEFSNGVKSALGLTASTGSTYTVTTIKTYGNTSATKGELKTITVTSAVSRDTALSELGVTTGEFNIWKDGVKYTALISSDETVGSFMDTLAKFGIEASIINNGNTSTIRVIGNGDAYVAKSSSINNASNVVDVLLPSGNNNTTYNYNGQLQTYNTVTTYKTATEDTLLSEFDTPWGGDTLKAAGKLALSVDGKNKVISISETETFGSLIDKLNSAGVEASLVGGKLYISEMHSVSIVPELTTSSIINPNAGIKLAYKNAIDGYMESSAAIEKTTTTIEEKTLSAANYADLDTQLKTLNISNGNLSIFRNGEKATIAINSENTFSDLRSQIASKFSDLDLTFENGKLVIFSKTDGVEVKIGSTTDSSNFLSITGLSTDENGSAVSSRALFCVNENSLLTAKGLFRNGDIKQGSFCIGEAVFNIDDKTTVYDLISQINSSEKSNATAYWDSINGNFVLKSRTTGAALINIEAGTSNLTDIMGFTESEWYSDGSVKITRMNTDLQKLGDNARVTINGTSYTATSNTLTSDITRIKGLTINLTGLTNGSAVTLKVEKDKETVANALSDVVNAYNELMKNVDEAVAKDGALKKQTTLKMIRNQIRNLMTSSIGGNKVFKNLDAIGISVAKASSNNISTSNESIIDLSFDKDKFLKAYEADSDAVKELLIGQGIMGAVDSTDGVFTKVEAIVENSLASVIGYFSITDEAYARDIKKIDNKIVKGNEAIEKYRARLNKKFQSMDMLISNMQNQYSSFLGT